MTSKQNPADRRKQILDAAVAEAREHGFSRLTRDGVAARCSLAAGTINKYFSTMTVLRRDVMRAAVRLEILPIIAAGVAAGDPHAAKAPQELKRRALDSLAA